MLVNKDWKIESGEMNVTLSKRLVNKKTGNKTWIFKGDFATLKGAVDNLVDKEINGTGLTDLQAVIKKIDDLKRSIVKEIE